MHFVLDEWLSIFISDVYYVLRCEQFHDSIESTRTHKAQLRAGLTVIKQFITRSHDRVYISAAQTLTAAVTQQFMMLMVSQTSFYIVRAREF